MSQLATPPTDDRIALLRERCRQRKSQIWPDTWPARAKALRESPPNTSLQEKQGLCTRQILSETVFAVDDIEMLLGRLAPRSAAMTDEMLSDTRSYRESIPRPGGQAGHCELDLSGLFRLGIDGLAEDVRSRLSRASPDAVPVYRSFLDALAGLSRMAENAAECARAAMPSSGPVRKQELRRVAAAAGHVAHQPPSSFHEALQLLWFAVLAVQYAEGAGLVGPGHLDRTLAHFYETDVDAGRLKPEEVLLLVESLYLLVNEFIPDGLAVPVMVGGRDASGRDVTNELSYICLEALRRTNLIYPTVGICWHEGTPRELVDLAIDLIAAGRSTPAFFGDATIRKGLLALGVPPSEACNYINSTCVEITPVGASNVWVASPYYNPCGLLLEEIAARADTPPSCFDEFEQGCLRRLRAAVAEGVDVQNAFRSDREQWGGKPLQSILTRDCLARGRDIDRGGARYNWIECSFVGLANLADSLEVIHGEVFESGRMTLAELKEVLDADFRGHEAVRQRFINGYPKYGQDDARVDGRMSRNVESVTRICREFTVRPDNSTYVPGAFAWVMHAHLGHATGATPDGRKAGVPLADGAGPAQGREAKGPTAAILSTTSWDPSPLIGGAAFNMKFNPSILRSHGGADRLRELILTFLRRGGFEIQVNVVDHATLKRGREDPEQYRDLIVRIGGYTDYFTRLSPAMQEEIILRTEYGRG